MNILEFYRIFAVIGFILIVKQIIFLCNKPQNVTCFILPFWISAFLWILETALFVFIDIFGKPYGLKLIESQSVVFILYILLAMQIFLTVLLYLFFGKYAEYNVIYNAKKRKQSQTINLEESHIILYGLLKFNKKTIFVRDVNIEESAYVMESSKSGLFTYASVLGSKEYFSVKLKNGEAVNIMNKHGVLSGANVELVKLTKMLGIKYV